MCSDNRIGEKNNFIYDTTILSDDLSRIILKKASYVLNKRYETLNDHQLPNGRRLIGVSLGNVRYSSLSMSAGEQKVFLILNTIFSAKKCTNHYRRNRSSLA